MTKPGLQFLVAVVAGWISRRQQEAIEYLQVENRLLRERVGPGRLWFSDTERFVCRNPADRMTFPHQKRPIP